MLSHYTEVATRPTASCLVEMTIVFVLQDQWLHAVSLGLITYIGRITGGHSLEQCHQQNIALTWSGKLLLTYQ